MQLSVVIPFYQVEKYIGACLDALAALPAEESEILLVDDRGRDGSAAIAAAYCAAHPNARVIRRAQNGGLSAARNTGLDAARGEYVYFLDSDDVPRAEALWRLTQAAREKRLDMAKARFCFLNDETGELTDGAAIRPTDVLEGGALLAAQCQSGTYEPMVWQCVYRRAFLLENGLRMAEGLLFEDELFQAPALIRAKRAAAFDAVGTEKQHAGGDVRRVEERMDVTQGKLSMGFTTGCTAGEAEYPALLVLNTVFGGGITSKLFTKVREELSLCYYAMSSIEKNKGVMIVSSGVEFDKLETAEKEILWQLEDCRNGEISDYEFESAKNYLLSDLKTALDSPGRLDDYAIGQRAAGLEGGMEKLARGIEAVTRGQVAEAARRVTLDTIFTLRGTEE